MAEANASAKRGRKVVWDHRCCEVCGGEFKTKPSIAKRTCGSACGKALAARMAREKWGTPLACCLGCGKEFWARMTGGARPSHCSRVCAEEKSRRVKAEAKVLASWAERNKEREVKACRVCGDVCTGARAFCCEQHRNEWYKSYHASRFKEKMEARLVEARPCAWCKESFTPKHLSSVYCTKKCSRRAGSANSPSRQSRKARIRGSADVERFSPLDVLERDGWACKLCGIDTPKSLRGTTNHNAPELDHIIPIAKGGPHSISNTQCLCRSCNALKSDLLMDEVLDLLA